MICPPRCRRSQNNLEFPFSRGRCATRCSDKKQSATPARSFLKDIGHDSHRTKGGLIPIMSVKQLNLRVANSIGEIASEAWDACANSGADRSSAFAGALQTDFTAEND